MAKKNIEFDQKYEIGTEVVCLTAKNIKEGYVFSESNGEIKSFNNKTNTYQVSVRMLNGEYLEVEYKEKELMLKTFDVESSDKTVEEAKANIIKLRKKMIIAGIGFSTAIILLIFAAILAAFLVNNEKLRIIFLIICLIAIIANGVFGVLFIKPINDEIVLNSRKLEAVALSEYEKTSKAQKEKNNSDADDVLIQIQRLKSLLDSRAITESEYEDAKKKLLKKL